MADSFKTGVVEGIKKAGKLGADGVQLYTTYGELDPMTVTDAKIAELRGALSLSGLAVSALCADFGGHGFQVASDNKERVEKSKRVVDMALKLDCNVVTTHIGVIPAVMCERKKIMAEACERLGEYADSMGAFFAVETGPEPSVVLKEFLDSLSSGGVRVNFDPANLAMVIGEDIPAAVRNLKDYIVHTHAKDGLMIKKTNPELIYGTGEDIPADVENENLKHSFYKEVPLGTGSVNFPKYLAALAEVGYNGFLTIEREVGGDPEDDIAMAVGFLRGIIN